MVAWLKSDRFPVQPSKLESQPSELSLFSKLLTHTMMKPEAYPQLLIAKPDTNDLVALGKYTADAFGDCYACHSGDMIKQDKLNPPSSAGYYGGGIEMKDEHGKPNLTFDEETGIARKYTKEQFTQAVRLGIRPDGSVLRYPMLPKLALSEREVEAIYEYSKTVPKLKNDIAQKTREVNLAQK